MSLSSGPQGVNVEIVFVLETLWFSSENGVIEARKPFSNKKN